MTTDYEAIVLIGHGSRRPEANEALERLRELVASGAEGSPRGEIAFLQFAAPDIAAAIESLALDGLCRIVLVPVFFYEGAHVVYDIPQIVEAERRKRPELTISVAPVLGIDERIASMVWDRIGGTAQRSFG